MVTQDEFKEKMGLENIQLIDVRTPEEVAGGKIDGSTNINVFDEDFKDKIHSYNNLIPSGSRL